MRTHPVYPRKRGEQDTKNALCRFFPKCVKNGAKDEKIVALEVDYLKMEVSAERGGKVL
jgi:hypothetical protein